MKKRLPIALSLLATLAALLLLEPAAWPRLAASLAGIIALVTLICVLTAVLELRCYLHRASLVVRPLVGFSRLPSPCALAFVASFASSSVAAVMLTDYYRSGEISRKELLLGGLCNSIPAVAMFFLYLTLPVIGIIGRAGVLYFVLSFAVLLLTLLLFLTLSRLAIGTATPMSASPPRPVPLPWPEVWRKTRKRTCAFLRRLALLTVPFFLWTACALQRGWLDFTAPAGWEALLSPGALSILASRVGGLLASSGTAAELLHQGAVTPELAVIALLIGNMLNSLTRMLRRGLPVSLGIYPGWDGAVIAVTSVGTRFVLTAAVVAVLWRMQR